MTDFAALQISIDATGAVKASDQLDRLGQSSKKVESSINDFERSSNKSFALIKESVLGLAAGFSAIQVASASFSAFRDFEKQISSVSTLVDESITDMTQLRDATLSLGATYGKLPAEQAKTFYQIISSGVTDTTKATELLDQANKLSIGGFSDLFKTADSLTSIMAAYGDKVKSVADISDTLFVGTLAGKTTIDELSSALGRVSPLAENLGVSFQELVSSVSSLTLSGISTNEAITGVRAVLSSVIKPSAEAAGLAKELGIQFDAAGLKAKGFGGFMEDVARRTGGSSEKISLLFGGVEAIVPALAFAGNAGKQFADIMGQMESRAGSTQTAFEKMAASPGFQIDKLMSSINSIAIRLGDTLAGVLVPAAEAASNALNKFFGATQKASAIDQQKQAIVGLRNELNALTDRKNVPLIGELLFDQKQADLLQSRIEHAESDLKQLIKTAEDAKKITQVDNKPLVPVAAPIVAKQETPKRSLSKDISESERFLSSLKKEAEEANKTNIELLKLQASKLGLTQVAAPLISQIERSEKALNDERLAASNLANDLNDVRQVTESVLTPTERLARETERLNKLLNLPNGAGLSMESYNRAIRRANDEFVKLSGQGKKTFEDVTQFAIQAERNIQTSFADALRLGFEGNLSGMVSSFKSALAQMASQAISADLLGSLFGKSQGFGNVGALLDTFKKLVPGSGSSAQGADGTASLLNGVTNLGGIFKDGFSSLKNVFGGGAGLSGAGRNAFTGASFLGLGGSSGSAFASGAGLSSASGAASLGTSFAAVAAPLLAAAVATSVLRSFAGEKRLGGGFGKALNAVGDIPIIGDFIPVVPLMNALFGRGPLKQKETNLIGEFGQEGFSGITSTKLKAEGGLFVGDKVIRIEADADTGKLLKEFSGKLSETAKAASEASLAVGKFLDEGIRSISKEVIAAADALGLGKDALKGFTQSINIASEKGKGLTEEQLTKAITGFSDAMARQLIPEIDNLTKSGETATGAFLRLGNEFNLLVRTMEVLGSSTASATEILKGASFEARNAFIEMAGGAEKLNTQLAFFADNFLSVEERIKPLQELVNKTFKELGISGISTVQQFADLVKSQDKFTEAGQKTIIALLDIQDEFLEVNKAFAGLGTTVQDVTKQLKKASDEQLIIASRRADLAARERKEQAAAKASEELAKARSEEIKQGELLRDSLLRAGDAAKLLANELNIKPLSINKDADQNTEIAKASARLATDLIAELSVIALEVVDVKQAISSLTRVAVSGAVVKPIADDIRSAITGGDKSDAINKSIRGLVNVLANNQASKGINAIGQGIGEVLAAQRKLSSARATESVNGRLQFGNDVIQFAKAIDGLNKSFAKGEISAEQHRQALQGAEKAMGGNAKLLNDTAAQMERIKKASLELGKAGLDSIGFYFNQITKSARELDREASELGTPLGKVSDAIGRLKSAAFVFAESAEAVRDGFKDIKPDVLRELSKAGGQLSKANIVANAAGIASQVITTIGGKQAQQKIQTDPLFKGKDARDLGLLIEGVTAFDPESFERAFTRLNAALAKGAVNEAQFAKLFNIALDSFEGLDSGINNTASSLGDLRKAAKSAADALLLDKKLSVLAPKQQLNVAENIFNDLIKRAKGGDGSAASELDGAARTLLEAGQAALSNQTDLFTFVQAQLRGVEQAGTTPRLEVDKSILVQLENMNKRLEEQKSTNELLSAQIASINMKTADTLDRWEKIGMPQTRT